MKTKFLLVLLTLGVVIATSCKKDSTTKKAELTPAQLTDVSDKTTKIFGDIQNFMFDALSVAVDSGKMFEMPPQNTSSAKTELSKIILQLKNAKGDFDWYGPDADGWYIRSWEGVYKYTEKIRCKDTVLTHIFETEYSGGDGSYSNVWETQMTKYTKNKKVLWQGYTDWKIKTFGQNDISDVQWRFEFTDWNPETGAGIYDWYWGAHSLGGGYEPYHRILNIRATEKGSDPFNFGKYLLHVKITWYDGSTEIWSFEYDTDWKPVEMPEMPCGQQSNTASLME